MISRNAVEDNLKETKNAIATLYGNEKISKAEYELATSVVDRLGEKLRGT